MNIINNVKVLLNKFFNFNPKGDDFLLKIYFKSIIYRKRHLRRNNFQWMNNIKLDVLNEKEGLIMFGALQFILLKNDIKSIPLHQKYLYAALISSLKIPNHYLLFWDDLIVFREIFIENTYDKKFHINEGDIVLDIGASVGFFACKISKLVGDTGKIIAIEPDPDNFFYLKKNIEKNNLKNIIPLNLAVWSSKIDTNLSCEKYASKLLNLSNLNEQNIQIKSKKVKCDTIDNIVLDLNLEKVNLIKMDIEGAEIEALKGAKEILSNSKNLKLIISAYHKDNAGIESYNTLIPSLKKLKYNLSEKDLPFIFAQN